MRNALVKCGFIVSQDGANSLEPVIGITRNQGVTDLLWVDSNCDLMCITILNSDIEVEPMEGSTYDVTSELEDILVAGRRHANYGIIYLKENLLAITKEDASECELQSLRYDPEKVQVLNNISQSEVDEDFFESTSEYLFVCEALGIL